jgi:hypothetical protein
LLSEKAVFSNLSYLRLGGVEANEVKMKNALPGKESKPRGCDS